MKCIVLALISSATNDFYWLNLNSTKCPKKNLLLLSNQQSDWSWKQKMSENDWNNEIHYFHFIFLLLFQLIKWLIAANLFQGEGRRLAAADLSDRHPLAVDGFNSDGDEGAQRVRA